MLDRDWVRRITALTFAIAGLIFIALAVINLIFLTIERSVALHQGWENQNKYESTQTEKASETIAKHCDITKLTPDRIANCLVNEISAYIEKKNSAQDMQAQKDMAYWAQFMAWIGVAGFLISVAGLLSLFVSLRQTRIAISDTRQIGEAQVRAYLSLDVDDGGFNLIGYKSVNPSVEAKIKNFGSSPALRSRYAATLLYRVAGFPSHNGEIITPTAQGHEPNHVVAPGGFFIGAAKCKGIITEDMWEAILQDAPTSFLFLVGVALYDDVFNKPHRTRFCLSLHIMERRTANDGKEEVRISWRHAPLHNDAT